MDRKTARRYVAAAEAVGVVREGGLAQLSDEVIGQVVAAVRSARAGGHGTAWEALEVERERISEWVGKDLSVVKIADPLARRGVLVPYRTLHRFCAQRCGFGRGGSTTVRVADEVARRDTNSTAPRARAAGLDPRMRLDTWDTTTAPRYDQQLWAELTTLRFLEGTHGALPLGPVGVGKTHLATALGHIAIRRRHSVHMARADKLFKRLKTARLDNTVEAEMRRLAHVQLLILDDFALQPLDTTETTDFHELIVERHRKAATIITSNREPSEWLTMMADPLLAQSAVDRLVSTAHELIIEGDSYRRRQKPTHTTKTHTNISTSVDQQNGDHHAH